MGTIKVILLRGKKDPLEWDHPDLKAALKRAFALAELHSAQISTNKPGQLVVNADHFYKRAR